uniref:Kinase n=2 Tax=Haemonchus contortus TaxID=6289 RepID=A0A7I4YK74_HAECO
MEEVPEQELPATYEWFADQIAGHHPSVIKNGKREIGLLKKRGSDKILKPKQEAFRGECEVNVYKLLARTLRHLTSGDISDGSLGDADSDGWPATSMEDAEGLTRMTPRFYGLTTVPIDKKDVDFLILEDVTSTYTLPAILDVKMGRITFDPLANAAKREKEERKYPPQTVLGFRLLGYRMHCKNGKIVVKDKEWGKSFDEHNILDGLLEFFSGRGNDPTLISEALSKLNYVREWFAKQTSFHFYASSLLFVYENDLQKPPNVHLVMIDFSHVFPSNNQMDTNYIAGLNVLHSKMEIILKKFTSTSASQALTH